MLIDASPPPSPKHTHAGAFAAAWCSWRWRLRASGLSPTPAPAKSWVRESGGGGRTHASMHVRACRDRPCTIRRPIMPSTECMPVFEQPCACVRLLRRDAAALRRRRPEATCMPGSPTEARWLPPTRWLSPTAGGFGRWRGGREGGGPDAHVQRTGGAAASLTGVICPRGGCECSMGFGCPAWRHLAVLPCLSRQPRQPIMLLAWW